MDRIPAAGNLTIEMDLDRWRLLANGSGQERLLLEARSGQPMRYDDIFASKRRLPAEGLLQLNAIQRVVLGYSNDDDSWHLGLLFEPQLASQRGSRWCEMARWPDPDPAVFRDTATRAGHALARTLGSPFNLIEPEPRTEVSESDEPLPPLRDLPLEFDDWTLEQRDQLQFTRDGRWARGKFFRIFWYGLLIVAYVGLAVLSLQGTLALTKPEFLPFVGLAVAAFLLVMVLVTIRQLLVTHRTLVVDGEGVAAVRGKRESWRVQRSEIEAVYVSEIRNRKGKKRTVHHGEINLFLKDGKFRLLISQPRPVEYPEPVVSEELQDGVMPLTTAVAKSDLQMAGLHVAQKLGVEARYDLRLK